MTGGISRQTLIRGALGTLAAGALLGSCRQSVSDPQSTPSGPLNWRALDDSLEGRIILPPSGEYKSAKGLFNTRFNDSTPAAVVMVFSAADVQQAVSFAASNGIKVTARSGGHSYVGDSAADGAMVIDLRRLPGGVAYDQRSQLATIPAAAALDSVQAALASHGRLIPTGTCPSVGITGLTLGGGLGSDKRQWGLTCDALTSATIVLPTGRTVTASAADHDDLYWALRGGGGGHFGVVTSLRFRTFPSTARDVVSLDWPKDVAAQVVSEWSDWINSADHTVWGMVNLNDSSSGFRCSVTLATPAGQGRMTADDLSDAIGTPPDRASSQTLSHPERVRYFAGGEDATRPRAVLAGSDIIGEMSSAAAESIVAAVSSTPPEVGAVTAIVESLSGAVRDTEPTGTAFPWRRHAASVQWYTEAPTGAALEAAASWMTTAHQKVRAHSAGGYVNYVESGDPPDRYFAGNLARLIDIRQKYDPDTAMYSSLNF